MKRYLSILIAAVLLHSCVYPYSAKLEESSLGLLAVAGDILIGETTTISLSYTFSLSELSTNKWPEGDVVIENDLGQSFPGTPLGKGKYSADTSTAPEDARYRLLISLSDGSRYETPWTGVQQAPQITDFSYVAGEHTVGFMISMDGADSLRNFRWDYQEDWEFHAPFVPTLFFVPGMTSLYGENPEYMYREPEDGEEYNNYHCWSSSSSADPKLKSTAGQSENRFKDDSFLTISRTDSRLMDLYSILVTARGMSDGAYAWHCNQLAISNSTGSLFEPVPSEMPGNVSCTSDPQRTVLGYVDAVKRVQKRLFVAGAYIEPYDPEMDLHYPEADEDGFYNFENLYLSESPVKYSGESPNNNNVLWGSKRCTDCRASGGSKNKPEWWPNDDR